MTKKSLITLFAAIGILLSAIQSSAGSFTAFGSKTFTRGTSKPVIETASFSIKNPDTSCTLKIYNGGINSEYAKVSSAVVKLNGSTIFAEKDFNQQVSTLQKQVNVSNSNQLQVELRSAPGSGLTILIEGEDYTPPSVTINSPSNGSYTNSQSATIIGSTSDSISWVNAVTVNGRGAAISGESYSASLQLSEGPNAITATATDAAGNTGSSSITVILDTIPPKITLDAVKTITNNPQLTLTGKIEDVSPISLTANGTPVNISNNTFSAMVNLTEGNNAITITATDKAGNTTVSLTNVTLDTVPPVVKITSQQNGQYLNTPQIAISGTVSEPVTVTINGISAGAIHESPGQFSSNLTLAAGQNTITAIATDEAGNTGHASLTLTLDTISPTITLNPVPSITNSPQIQVRGTVEDANPIDSVTINGKSVGAIEQSPFQFNTELTLSEGLNTIEFTATDKAGNSSKTETAILLDTTPPTVTITSPVSQGTFNTSSLTVRGTSKDESSGTGSVTVNGTNAEISGEAYSTTVQLKEGENQITATATDAAGNTGQSAITIYLDTIAPAISISSPEDGSVVNTEIVTVTGTIDDNTATVTVNGISATVSSNTFTVPGIALIEGANSISATATDQVGNQSTAVITITRLTKDTTAPVLRIMSPSEGYTSEYQEIEVLGTIDDDSATVMVNGTIAKVFKRGTDNYFTASGIKLMEGRNIITVMAVDGAGNTGAAIVTVTYMTKNSGITIQYPFDGSIVNYQWLGVWGTVADNITNVMVNGIPAKVFSNSFSATLTLIEGPNTITVSAYDIDGNTVTKSITVTYQYMDTTAPAISITSPSNGSTLTNRTITVIGTVDDNTATVSVSGINATVSNNTFTASNISLMEGANTISATAADPAGNTSSSSITVYLDTVAPTVLSTTPLNNATDVSLDSNISVNFSEAIDLSTITTSNITLSSPAGNVSGYLNQSGNTVSFVPLNKLSYATTYTATIKGGSGGVKDMAGNAMQQDYIWTFTTKDEPPIMMEITEPQSGAAINKEKAMIKGTIKSKATDVGVTVNGIPAEINGGTWVALVPLKVGQNTVEVKATDSAGNTATQTITINTASSQQSVTITTNPSSGIAPLNTTFSIDTNISNTVTSYKIDYDGNGVTDLETTTTSGINHTYDTPGIYYPTVTVTDSLGNGYTETTAVNVLSKDEMDALLKGKWDGMKGAMGSGDITTALSNFDDSIKDKFSRVFTDIGSDLPAIAASLEDITLLSFTGDIAEYAIGRNQDGQRYIYFIYFMKDKDGIWKIKGM